MSLTSDREGNISTVIDTRRESNLRKKIEGRKELRKKLKSLGNENDELKNLIKKKDMEIVELTDNVSSLNDLINSVHVEKFGCGSSVASAKIMELCKKNRQLVSEIEVVKSKYTILEATNLKLEKEVYQSNPKSTPTEQSRTVACCSSASKLDTLSSQHTSTKQKLFEALNQISELKSNLKLTQKCLQLETGQQLSTTKFSAPNSNRRERAQQIIALQNKVAELKEQIGKAAQGNEPIKQQLRKLEATKKVELQNLTQKINELNNTVENQQKKIGILKARNKNLSDDAMNYRLKTLNLLEKFGTCDNSITALQEKSTIQQFQHEAQVMEWKKKLESMQTAMDQTVTDYNQMKIKWHNLETLNQEKDNTISKLKFVIEKLETDLKNISGGFLFSCRDFQKEEFVALLDALESEKKDLLKYNTDLNERVEEEREKADGLFKQLSKQRVKYCRLEAKLKELIKEQETQYEKRKRSQKVSEYSQNLSAGISTIIFEKSDPSDDGPTLQIEDLKNKLDFATERVTFLEEKLSVINNERKADIDTFNLIISSSRDSIAKMIDTSRQVSKSHIITLDNVVLSKSEEVCEHDSGMEVN